MHSIGSDFDPQSPHCSKLRFSQELEDSTKNSSLKPEHWIAKRTLRNTGDWRLHYVQCVAGDEEG
jgi:hypothetical protein